MDSEDRARDERRQPVNVFISLVFYLDRPIVISIRCFISHHYH